MIDHVHALPEGYQLQEYTITGTLGFGGFGITYSAHDRNLDKNVAIKEYLPAELAVRIDGSTVSAKSARDQGNFDWGLQRFIDEARAVAKFNHPNIIRIHRFFQQNGTGYIVMEYLEGQTLNSYLQEHGTLQEAEIRRWLLPLMDGLKMIHAAGFIHRDIKPQNIMMGEDGIPVLIDFGAARMAIGGMTRSLTSIMTPGYAPLEQYESHGKQGPWTDIYALGAVMYHCVIGKKPPDAFDRIRNDQLKVSVDLAVKTYSPGLIRGILAALSVQETDRPQDIDSWRAMLDAPGHEATVKMPDQRHAGREPAAEPPRARETRREPQVKKKPGSGKWPFFAIPVLLLAIALGYWFFTREQVFEPLETQHVASETTEESILSPEGSRREEERQAETVAKLPYEGIEVTSTPPGADILIDGQFAGVTPASLRNFERGRTATLRLQLAGYEPAEQIVTAPEEGSRDVSFTLTELILQYPFTVEPEPPDATVKILNIEPRYQPGMLLVPGRYHVEVSKGGYQTQTQWVDLAEGELLTQISLAPDEYTLAINTQPPSANIRFLNVNTTYRPGMKLAPGRYQVEVSAEGYATSQQWLEITQADLNPQIELEAAFPTGKVFRDCDTCPEMVVIPAGSFQMGSPSTERGRADDEGPIHRVTVDAFAAGKFEITVGQFEDFVNATNYLTDAEKNAGGQQGCYAYKGGTEFGWASGASFRNPGWPQTAELPAVCISWNDAKAYVAWLARTTGKSYRLPSEAELEYINRAGTNGRFPWGEDDSGGCGMANGADLSAKSRFSGWSASSCRDGHVFTSPVGSLRSNAYGLFDASGNVWEWSEDCWHENYASAPSDGTAWRDSGDCSLRVLRGGSWSDDPGPLRSASRGRSGTAGRGGYIGFRVAQDLPQ